jgi:4-hydroxy-3-methylbut-2-enyl diphosphate reductase
VKQRALERGLNVIDATCPDVARTHDLVRALVAQGYQIIYIGKKGHPEPEGVMGEAPGSVYLVENEDDLAALPEHLYQVQRLAVSTQTTLSRWDTARLVESIKARFPQVEVYNEICHATQVRQEAVANMARGADLTIVVGDERSNNTNRLVQVAEEIAGSTALRVDSVHDLEPEMLMGKQRIAITSGASTPSHITREVIRYVETFGSAAPVEQP